MHAYGMSLKPLKSHPEVAYMAAVNNRTYVVIGLQG